MEGEGGDGGGVLLRCAVWGDLVCAALIGSADEVEDGPGEGIERGGAACWAGGEFVVMEAGLQDREKVVVAGAEDIAGLAAMPGFTADGEEEPVEILLVTPELHANGDGGGEAVAKAGRGADAVVGEGLELSDGEVNGGGVDVLFGFEVEVEGAFGDVGGGGDVLDASVGESFFAEDLDGGDEDLLTAQVGEDLLAGRDVC